MPVDPKNVKFKNRLQPGRMFLVDTEAGRIIDDRELKQRMAARKPYAAWLKENLLTLEDLPDAGRQARVAVPARDVRAPHVATCRCTATPWRTSTS